MKNTYIIGEIGQNHNQLSQVNRIIMVLLTWLS